MKESEKIEVVTRDQREAAKMIYDSLTGLIDLADTNNLKFVAYILRMAAEDTRDISRKNS